MTTWCLSHIGLCQNVGFAEMAELVEACPTQSYVAEQLCLKLLKARGMFQCFALGAGCNLHSPLRLSQQGLLLQGFKANPGAWASAWSLPCFDASQADWAVSASCLACRRVKGRTVWISTTTYCKWWRDLFSGILLYGFPISLDGLLSNDLAL